MSPLLPLQDALSRRWGQGPFAKRVQAALVVQTAQKQRAEIFGTAAEMVEVRGFDGGVLTVAVSEVAAVSLLRARERHALRAMQEAPSLRAVESIRYQLS